MLANKEKIRKNYMYISITGWILSIYVILFPIISEILGKISGELNKCVFLKTTGKPCPLCGGTRYIKNIGHVFQDITYLANPFGVIILCVIFEIFFRIYCLYCIKKGKNLKKLITFDIIVHSIMAISFFLYEIIYLYNLYQ